MHRNKTSLPSLSAGQADRGGLWVQAAGAIGAWVAYTQQKSQKAVTELKKNAKSTSRYFC